VRIEKKIGRGQPAGFCLCELNSRGGVELVWFSHQEHGQVVGGPRRKRVKQKHSSKLIERDTNAGPCQRVWARVKLKKWEETKKGFSLKKGITRVKQLV